MSIDAGGPTAAEMGVTSSQLGIKNGMKDHFDYLVSGTDRMPDPTQEGVVPVMSAMSGTDAEKAAVVANNIGQVAGRIVETMTERPINPNATISTETSTLDFGSDLDPRGSLNRITRTDGQIDDLGIGQIPVLETPPGMEPTPINFGTTSEEIENDKAQRRAEMPSNSPEDDAMEAEIPSQEDAFMDQIEQVRRELATQQAELVDISLNGSADMAKNIAEAIQRSNDALESQRAQLTDIIIKQWMARHQAQNKTRPSGDTIANYLANKLIGLGEYLSTKAIQAFCEQQGRPTIYDQVLDKAIAGMEASVDMFTDTDGSALPGRAGHPLGASYDELRTARAELDKNRER